MIPKRVSLPFPPRRESLAPTFAARTKADLAAEYERRIAGLMEEVDTLTAHAVESICGGTDETQPVELYDGTLDVSVAFVNRYQAPVGQLKWYDDLASRFSATNETPGNLAGQRWGSGGLIAPDLFLTAGHCFDSGAGAWGFPKREGKSLESPEIATCMAVNFGYQVDGRSPNKEIKPGECFPVVELVEHRVGGLDFAIVRLGRNRSGKLPGDVFGTFALAPAELTTKGATLCLIQHPNGMPKGIETGKLRDNAGGRITYDDLDTMGGSSGALLLHGDSGEVIGVHTNGGCTKITGFNFGVSIGIIRYASPCVRALTSPTTTGSATTNTTSTTSTPVSTTPTGPTTTGTTVSTNPTAPTTTTGTSPTTGTTASTTPDLDARLARFERVMEAIAQALV